MKHHFKKAILSREHFYWLVLIFVFTASVWFIFTQTRSFFAESDEVMNELSSGLKTRRITRFTLDYGNGKKRVFEGRASEEMRLVIVFGGIEKAAGTVFGFRGGRIVEVDGIKNGSGKNWVYYVNGAKQTEDPFLKSVLPGDEIVVKYE